MSARVALKSATLLCSAMLAVVPAWCAAKEVRRSVSLEELPQSWHEDSGQDFSLASLHGRRVVFTMAYASCHRICPLTIDGLRRLQRLADARGEAVEFVIVGYDPVNDDPRVWREYRLSRRLNRANWHFLNGPVAAVEQLARQLGFPFWKYDEHVMHESRAVLFDTQGLERAVLGSRISQWPDAF